MKLTFLGTGAADWSRPAPNGERRRLCSTRIGESLLIDGTRQILDILTDPEAITHIVYTHEHGDHFDRGLWESLPHARHLAPFAGEGLESVEPLIPFEAGGMKLTAVRGNHSVPVCHYLVEDGEKTLYYALDSAWLAYGEYAFLRGKTLDGMVIDATIGDGHEGDYRVFEHNSLAMVRIMVDSLRATGILRENAPVFVSHLAFTLHPSSDELRASLTPGYIAPMDSETYEI